MESSGQGQDEFKSSHAASLAPQDIKKGQSLGLSVDPGVELVEADVLKPEQVSVESLWARA